MSDNFARDLVIITSALAVMFDRVTLEEAQAVGLDNARVVATIEAAAEVGARIIRSQPIPPPPPGEEVEGPHAVVA